MRYADKVVLQSCNTIIAYCFLGFLFGFVIALITKREKPVALTIGIETAVQNTSIAIILLRTSLDPPWSEIR